MVNPFLKLSPISWVLIILCLPGIILRFLWLDQIPPGLSHDEIDPIKTALTYLDHGTDNLGTSFPKSLITSQLNSGDDTLYSLFLAPFYKIIPFTFYSTRIPAVIINLLTACVLMLLILRLSQDKILSLLSSFIFLYSPWSILFSRSLIQAPLALLLILLSLTLFYNSTCRQTILSGLFLFLAFFVYFGAKPVTLALALLLPPILLIKKKVSSPNLVLFYITFLPLVAVYFFFTSLIPDSTFSHRISEVSLLDLSRYSRIVEEQRRLSISSAFTSVFSNKPLSFTTNQAQKYSGFFSPEFLFFSGDTDPNFRFADHGVAYLPDGLFLLLGISVSLVSSLGMLGMALMTLFGPLPTLVNIAQPVGYMFRGFLFLPGLVIIDALGFRQVLKKYGPKVFMISLFMYMAFVSNFLYFYFFRLPVASSEASFFSERLLQNYLLRSSSKVLVVTHQPQVLAEEFDVYARFMPHSSHVQFTNTCPHSLNNQTLVVQSGISCQSSTSFVSIDNPKDAGTLWRIYSDDLCKSASLDVWKRFNLRSDYSVESLSTSQFCNHWISLAK